MMPLLNHNPPEGNCKHMKGGETEKLSGFKGIDAKNRGAEWEKVHSGMD